MRFLLMLLSLFVFISCDETKNSSIRNETPGLSGLLSIDNEADFLVSPQEFNVSTPTVQKQKQQIIRTSRLRFETQDLEKTKAQIVTAIKNAQGFIQDDDSGKDYNQIYQRITLRVPNKNFEKVIEDIGKGVAYFDERTISREDVTEEFIDLDARLRAKTKLEERYIALLAKAKNVKEMLEIERELAKIREEIESKQGRLKYLENQVSLSTIYVHFYTVTSETGATVSYGTKIVNALKSGWNGISIFFLGLLHIWPFLILVGVGVFFVRRLIIKNKKK